MKKFFSIIACVAMLCAPLFVATSCGSDDDSSPRKEGMVVNAYYPADSNTSGLSSTSYEAGGDAMKAVQAALHEVEFTTNEAAEKLLKETVETELAKLPNDVRFELKYRSVRMYFSIQKTNPLVEYTYDCISLEAEVPQLELTVKSVESYASGVNSVSESTRNLIAEASKKLNETMAGKKINTTFDKCQPEMAAMAAQSLPAELLASIKACPEAQATSSDRYLPMINITYTSNYIGHMNQAQVYPMALKDLVK